MALLDHRVAVVLLGPDRPFGPTDAVLAEAGALVAGAMMVEWFEAGPGAPHRLGCACCGGTPSAAAAALRRLFLRRVAGSAWFGQVVVVPVSAGGAAAVLAALDEDPFVSSRFRLG